jgi:hypothetical protein
VRRIQLAAFLVGTLVTAGAWSYPQPVDGQRIDAEVSMALHDLAEAQQMLRYGNSGEAERELSEIHARLDAIRALVGTPVVAGPVPMPERELSGVLRRLSMMWNPQERLAFVGRVAQGNFFTVEEVLQITQLFWGPREKVEVIETLAPKIVDPENCDRLEAVVSYPEGRRRIARLFVNRAQVVVPSVPSAF